MKIVRSELHRLHAPGGELHGGEFVRPFECPKRWDVIVDRLVERGYANQVEPDNDAFDLSIVQSVHTPEYLEFLEFAWSQWSAEGNLGDAILTTFPARRMHHDRVPKSIEGKLGYYAMAVDTAITSGTWEAAKSAAACAITAQRSTSAGNPTFALCRPPGHHAAKDLYGGYCFLNNAALAAEGFIKSGAGRVALLDVDFHHGNGSQDIFYDRDDVLFCSIHGHPEDAFPHFLGFSDETGTGVGEGFNRNYPLRPNTKYHAWSVALLDACKVIKEYSPDALVVSLGVDTYKEDPMGFFKLNQGDFRRCGDAIRKLKLPTCFVMEGGYAMSRVGVNTVNVLDGFSNA